jgi:hypothetical protein
LRENEHPLAEMPVGMRHEALQPEAIVICGFAAPDLVAEVFVVEPLSFAKIRSVCIFNRLARHSSKGDCSLGWKFLSTTKVVASTTTTQVAEKHSIS